ncbi:MAG: hypothetical protein HQL70_04685 [Magnetococcales bacterium]|nr:hypothetical protein [Magnetococcales bacterium]
MAQSIEGRLAQLKWLGDMEPEYEEVLEWMNLACGIEAEPVNNRSALDWAVIAQSSRAVSGGFSGPSNGLSVATLH